MRLCVSFVKPLRRMDHRCRAFLLLDQTARQGAMDLGALPIYPAFKNLHSDPRWLPFLRKHEQLAAIKFDVKVPK